METLQASHSPNLFNMLDIVSLAASFFFSLIIFRGAVASDHGARTRLMRAFRRESAQSLTGQAGAAVGSQSPKTSRDVRAFFRLNK